jgi:hypothetical protein
LPFLDSFTDANSAVALTCCADERGEAKYALCAARSLSRRCIAYESSIEAKKKRALCIAPTLWYLHDHSRFVQLAALRADRKARVHSHNHAQQ